MIDSTHSSHRTADATASASEHASPQRGKVGTMARAAVRPFSLRALFASDGLRKAIECVEPWHLQEKHVEAGMWPLVKKLNGVPGVSTIASCQGHVRVWPFFGRRPYVYFYSTPDFAIIFNRAIDPRYNDELELRWQLSGASHPTYDLCFTLESNPPGFDRRALNHDIAWLCRWLETYRKSIPVVDWEFDEHDFGNIKTSTGDVPC
jgi:hypothetical protein